MKTGKDRVIFATGWSLSPMSSWTLSLTRTTARRQTPSAWTALTAWKPASLPAPQTTSQG